MVVLLAIAILVCIYAVLTVAALGYSVTHKEEPYKSVPYNPEGYGPEAHERYKAGTSGISWGASYNEPGHDAQHIIVRLVFIFVEPLHLGLSFYRYRSNRHHPVAALCVTFLCLGLWITLTFWRAFLDFMVPEVPLSKAWLGLSYTCTAIGGLISILYFVYMGYAAAAVHVWRREKKEKERIRKASLRVADGSDEDKVDLERDGR